MCDRKVFSRTSFILVESFMSNITGSTTPDLFLRVWDLNEFSIYLSNIINITFFYTQTWAWKYCEWRLRIRAVGHCCCLCGGLYNCHCIYDAYVVSIFFWSVWSVATAAIPPSGWFDCSTWYSSIQWIMALLSFCIRSRPWWNYGKFICTYCLLWKSYHGWTWLLNNKKSG